MLNQSDPMIILGSGYTGTFLGTVLRQSGRPFVATSRFPDINLAHLPHSQRVLFDLAQPKTWGNLPRNGPVIWCFPATPLEFVQAFAQTCLSHVPRLVVLGSTAAYRVSASSDQEGLPPWIDESFPIQRSLPRVQGEEYLRTQYGAIILRIAGIYGPGRHVLNWIREGRVTASPRYVNLVHIEDLAGICLSALEWGTPGETYNVSDGAPRPWSDICEEAQRRWGVSFQIQENDRRRGKRISNEKIHKDLHYCIQHPDLFKALGTIESSESTNRPHSGQNDKYRETPPLTRADEE